MVYVIIVSLTLAIAIAIQALSAWLQRKHKIYSHLGPMAWTTHQFVIAPAWVIFFLFASQLGRFVQWPMILHLPGVGWLLGLIALLMFAAAIQQVGFQCLTNGDVFGHRPKRHAGAGIYQYLQNPVYDSLTLLFVAAALITNNFAYITLAAVTHVLLNHVMVKVENWR